MRHSRYREAEKRVNEKAKFFKELGSYVPVALMLIFINVFTSPGYMWCWWPIGFWGLALVTKGIKIATNNKTDDWKREAIKKELRNMGEDVDQYDEDYLDLNDHPTRQKEFQKVYRDSDLV